MGGKGSKADLEEYRQGYPNTQDDPNANMNYLFYSGTIPSDPQGDFIDVIHKDWWGNMALLESHHGYIQWLFPIRESGLNAESQPLQLHEITKIKAAPECINRFKKSYAMELHFYGVRIKDEQTGELERHEEWQKHYQNLNHHYHNNLRITRILKSLGELGFEHYKRPFLEHFIKEIWVEKLLPNCADSCADYWIGTIKDNNDRAALEAKVAKYCAIPAEGDSDSEDAVEQSWTSSRPTVHPYSEHEADGAGSDDEDESRASSSKTIRLSDDRILPKKKKRITKESKSKDDEHHMGHRFYITGVAPLPPDREKKYREWIGGGPGSDETDSDDATKNTKREERYLNWTRETLEANSDDEYPNNHPDDDDN